MNDLAPVNPYMQAVLEKLQAEQWQALSTEGGRELMNAVKHAEYMSRAMNAEAMPAPYVVRRELDRYADLLRQLQESKDREAQNYTAGVAEGWRKSFWWRTRHTFVLVTFGACVGVTLAVIVGPMLAFMGAGA